MSGKSFLIISRSAPYGSSAARDALDVALTCAVFEQPVTLLFMDDGVLQLLAGQDPQPIGQKNLNAVQQSLPLYDIERLCVCRASLDARGLETQQLLLPVEAVAAEAIAQLIAEHDVVLSI